MGFESDKVVTMECNCNEPIILTDAPEVQRMR